jgi:GST-like protein
VHLAEKFGAFLPAGAARAECLSWLFWQMAARRFSAAVGHFYAYAPTKIE